MMKCLLIVLIIFPFRIPVQSLEKSPGSKKLTVNLYKLNLITSPTAAAMSNVISLLKQINMIFRYIACGH